MDYRLTEKDRYATLGDLRAKFDPSSNDSKSIGNRVISALKGGAAALGLVGLLGLPATVLPGCPEANKNGGKTSVNRVEDKYGSAEKTVYRLLEDLIDNNLPKKTEDIYHDSELRVWHSSGFVPALPERGKGRFVKIDGKSLEGGFFDEDKVVKGAGMPYGLVTGFSYSDDQIILSNYPAAIVYKKEKDSWTKYLVDLRLRGSGEAVVAERVAPEHEIKKVCDLLDKLKGRYSVP